MAFESGRVPQETQDYLASKARSKNSEVAAAVLVALLTCMLIVSIFIKSGDAKKVGATHEALVKSDAPVLPYKPKELVAEATSAMAKRNFQDVLDAISELREIDRKRPAVESMFNRANRELQLTAAKEARVERLEYAKDFERNRLEAGEDYIVRAQGPNADVLSVTFVLINRPYVYNMENDPNVRAKWSALGFKSVRLSDGFDSSWSFTLN